MAPSVHTTGSDNTCLNARWEEWLIHASTVCALHSPKMLKENKANTSSSPLDLRHWSFSSETYLKRIHTNLLSETWHFCTCSCNWQQKTLLLCHAFILSWDFPPFAFRFLLLGERRGLILRWGLDKGANVWPPRRIQEAGGEQSASSTIYQPGGPGGAWRNRWWKVEIWGLSAELEGTCTVAVVADWVLHQ